MGSNIFDIGKSGMTATRLAMKTASHNIANANNEDYSRQKVDQSTGLMIPAGGFDIGSGVLVNKISRVNDPYLEKRIHSEAKNLAFADEQAFYLGQTEEVFNEANTDGLNRLVTRFFNEFRKLSTEPENGAIRSSVLEASKHLISDINRMHNTLTDIQGNIDSKIEGYVRDFNGAVKEITQLNSAIASAQVGGKDAPPDLYDKRDKLMKELANTIDIQSNTDEHRRVTIVVARKTPVVTGGDFVELSVARTPKDPVTGKGDNRLDIFSEEPVKVNMTKYLKGGRLGALIEVRDKIVQDAKDKINLISFQLAKQVNEIHQEGYGLDGVKGRKFFTDVNNLDTAAEDIKIATPILNSADAIATAKIANAPGDNRVAIAISRLADAKGVEGSDQSLTQIYNSMVGQLGVQAGEAVRVQAFQEDLMGQLKEFKEAISGVSLDEETANLVQLQHTFAANAKVLQIANEGLQSVMGILR